MRKLAFVAVALLCMGAAPPQPSPSQPAAPAAAAPDATASNVLRPQQGLPGEIVLTPPAHCLLDTAPRRADGQTLAPRRLDQLPQANLSLTVMREVNGCPQATIVREGIGGPAFRAETQPGR